MTTHRADINGAGLACPACGNQTGIGDAFCGRCGAGVGPALVDGLDQRIGLADFQFQLAVEKPSLRGRVGRVVRGLKARLRVAVLAVLIVTVAGVGAFWGVSYTRNAPVRDALDRAEARIGPVNEVVARAGNVDELVAAVGSYAAIANDLDGLRVDVSTRGGDLAAAAERMIGAQSGLALSASGIASVPAGDVAEWGAARTALLNAVEEYDEARAVLDKEDGDRARDAALPDDYEQHVQDLMDQAVLGTAGEGLEGMSTRLTQARLTSDLRRVASDAGDAELVLRSVMSGFDESSAESSRLASLSDLYAALSALSGIDGDHLSDWAGIRQGIVSAAASLKLEERSFNARVRDSLGAVDNLVQEAQRQLREWRADYRNAVAAKSADAKAFADYKAAMSSQLERYSSLRLSLSDWIARVEDPANFVTYAEAYDVLWRAQTDREAVRDAMIQLTVPSTLTHQHAALLEVVDDAIAAVSAAYQGAMDADFCTYTCYYKDSPGWQLFISESSRITDEYATRTEDWRTDVSAASEDIRKRTLPERPVV